jgi:fructokinase
MDSTGGASYAFYGSDTADWQWKAGELPDPGRLDDVAVHSGSLATALLPGAATLAAWLDEVRSQGGVLLSYDPNVRASLVADWDRFRAEIEHRVAASSLVKVSADDLALLYPAREPQRSGRSWAGTGPELVVVTRGAAGATAWRPDGTSISRPAPAVEVKDTVGAGDSFTSGLLAWLHSAAALRPGGIAALADDLLAQAVELANALAALSCATAGANPPQRHQLSRCHLRGGSPLRSAGQIGGPPAERSGGTKGYQSGGAAGRP